MGSLDPLALADNGGPHLDDPAAAWPVRLDVLRRFPGPQIPCGVTPMPFLVIRCGERDLALALELAADLAMEGLLVPPTPSEKPSASVPSLKYLLEYEA